MTAFDSKGIEVQLGDQVQVVPKRSNGFVDAVGEVLKITFDEENTAICLNAASGEIVVDTNDVVILF